MRRVAELGRGAALVAQGRVSALGLGRGREGRLGVLPLDLLLLLFVAGQAEEEAEDGFQIAIPNLFCRQTLDVDSFGCQETEAGIDVLNHLRAALGAAIDVVNLLVGYDLYDLSQQHSIRDVCLQVLDQTLVSRLGKVVVGPVRVNLRSDTKTQNHGVHL